MGSKAKPINEKFFDTWTEESAYVLGFIYADGHLQEEKGAMRLWLHNDDKDILEQMKAAMASESNIYQYGKHHKFCVTNKYLTDRLRELGLTPKKSLTIQFPDVPHEYLRHFIRGYFDGNGHFTYEDKGTGSRRLVSGITCGSESFINVLSDVLHELGLKRANVGYIDRRSSGRGVYYQMRYYKTDSIRLYHLMYDNATIYMRRKKEYADQYIRDIITPDEFYDAITQEAGGSDLS